MAFPSIALYRPHPARNVTKMKNGQNGQISFEKLGLGCRGSRRRNHQRGVRDLKIVDTALPQRHLRRCPTLERNLHGQINLLR